MSEEYFDKKKDKGKMRYDLLPFECLDEIVKRYTFGAEKYGDNNWKIVPDAKKRYEAALLRHFSEYKKGNIVDENDGGMSHLSAVAWNAIALIWFEIQEKNADRTTT